MAETILKLQQQQQTINEKNLPQQVLTVDSIETSNRFDPLPQPDPTTDDADENMTTDEDDDYETVIKKIKNKNKNKSSNITHKAIAGKQQQQQQPKPGTSKATTQNKNNATTTANTNNNNTTTTTTTTPSKRNLKPPPIHIHHQEIGDTIKAIKGSQIQEFNVKRVSREKHTLQMDSLENYKKAKKILNQCNTNYFTYTPKAEKPKTIVLKGLHEDEDINEIKEAIKLHGINVTGVTQLRTKHATKKNIKLPLYIVQCAPDTNIRQLHNITSINYQKIAWENLKKTDDIMQCYQCQRFGHVAANCNLKYRCVKCDGDHEPQKCPIKDEIQKEEIYCANCKAKGHPASYKGCPVYIATVARLKERIQEKRTQTHKPAQIEITKNTYVNKDNGTFAEMLTGKKRQQPQQQQQQQQETITINDNSLISSRIDKIEAIMAQQAEQLAQLLGLINQLIK